MKLMNICAVAVAAFVAMGTSAFAKDKPIYINSYCGEKIINVVLNYRGDGDSKWVTVGYWTIEPYEGFFPKYRGERLYHNPTKSLYFYGESVKGGGWTGDLTKKFDGRYFDMRKFTQYEKSDRIEIRPSCN